MIDSMSSFFIKKQVLEEIVEKYQDEDLIHLTLLFLKNGSVNILSEKVPYNSMLSQGIPFYRAGVT